jgi:uncharacterized membrane protein (UPF0127 family)
MKMVCESHALLQPRPRTIGALAGALALLLAAAGDAAAGGIAVPLVILRSDGVTVRFAAELAATPTARRRGLMHRTVLPARHGMWFDFEAARPVAMWMKDTPLPLDMLFVADDGRVVTIRTHTEPGSLTPIVAAAPVRYVLELNAGEAARYALAVGDRVVAAPR